MKGVTYGILIVCVSLWASNFIIGTILISYWSAIAVSFFRVMCIALFLYIVGRKTIQRAKPSKREWTLLGIAGLLGVSINHFTFFKSLEATTPVTAAYILALTPIATGIINRIIYKERKPLHFWLGASLAFIGVGLVISGNYEGQIHLGVGELLSFLTMMSFALFLIMIDKLRQNLSSFVITFYTTVIGGIGLLPFFLSASTIQKMDWNLPILILLIVSAILVHGVSNLVWNEHFHKVGSTNAAILLNLEPIITMMLSMVFLHTIIAMPQYIGGLAVVVGVVIAISNKRKRFSVNIKPSS